MCIRDRYQRRVHGEYGVVTSDYARTYKISAYEPGLLVLKLVECQGLIKLNVARSYEDYKISLWLPDTMVNDRLETTYEYFVEEPIHIFAKVHVPSIFSHPSLFAEFKFTNSYLLSAQFFTKEQVAQRKRYVPGGTGNIRYKTKPNRNIEYSFDTPVLVEGNASAVNITYTLIVTTQDALATSLARCGKHDATVDFPDEVKVYQKIDCEGKEKCSGTVTVPGSEPFAFINVGVVISDPLSGEKSKLFYTRSQVQVNSAAESGFGLLFILGGFLLIALASLVVVFYRKYRETTKQLAFELQDVRNVALRSDIQIQCFIPLGAQSLCMRLPTLVGFIFLQFQRQYLAWNHGYESVFES
eukprot:TRINITY_DN6648_c0_g1_i1.p1 TRINITY_DN6648_c0_g1~~TRINITY_DN6648_c0_g1_i1.p1  ORF type:complete len:356 (+),score=55.54 TRINITY_DN6648_c0_g1_i1:66-1133(+)